MQNGTTLDSFLGNPRVVGILRRAIAKNRLPHAMIFAGPEGVGKRTLALLLAQNLNCLAPKDREACGSCRSCRKILIGMHPDVREIRPEGAYIKIEQIRAVINEIVSQPFEGKYRVMILDGADQMRNEAAHSLLKTLEEPPSRTFLILITTNPYALLDTIRSRCRMVQFGGIAQEQIEQDLILRQKRAPKEAQQAALFSNGSLGAATSFDSAKYQEVREQALHFVRLLLEAGGFTEVSRLLAMEVKDKDTEAFQLWMESVANLLRDIYYAQIAPRRMAQKDIADELQSIGHSVSRAAVLSAIDGLKSVERAFLRNANRQIALESLYLAQQKVSHS